MIERRESVRDRRIDGGGAAIDERSAAGESVVHNRSEKAASLEFSNVVRLPKTDFRLTMARRGRSLLARIIWWRDSFVGVAFHGDRPSDPPVSDLAERLRQSEKKKRQLQRRINKLIDEG